MNDGLGNPKNTRSMLLVHQGGPAMSLGVRASAEAAVRGRIPPQSLCRSARGRRRGGRRLSEIARSRSRVRTWSTAGSARRPSAARRSFSIPRWAARRAIPSPFYCDKKLHDVGSRGKYDGPTDKFTTPRLIEVWRTAPYMHDGQYLTIKDLLVKGKHGLHPDGDNELSAADIDDLVEFVLSL